MDKRSAIFLVILLMGAIVAWEFWGDLLKDKISARDFYYKISEMKNSNNKYSVKVSNKNWTWDDIIFYKCAFPGMWSRKRESFLASKMSNTLYLKDKRIGVLFDISFENEELKLIFVLRDDIKIRSNSHLKQVGRDFLIIENVNGVYDDKKEFKYIENDNSLPYENYKFFRFKGDMVKFGNFNLDEQAVILNCLVYMNSEIFTKLKEKERKVKK